MALSGGVGVEIVVTAMCVISSDVPTAVILGHRSESSSVFDGLDSGNRETVEGKRQVGSVGEDCSPVAESITAGSCFLARVEVTSFWG